MKTNQFYSIDPYKYQYCVPVGVHPYDLNFADEDVGIEMRMETEQEVDREGQTEGGVAVISQAGSMETDDMQADLHHFKFKTREEAHLEIISYLRIVLSSKTICIYRLFVSDRIRNPKCIRCLCRLVLLIVNFT